MRTTEFLFLLKIKGDDFTSTRKTSRFGFDVIRCTRRIADFDRRECYDTGNSDKKNLRTAW
jgi:hypothetical protein